MRNPFRYFNSSPEVIRLTVMMYIRYPLSLRQVEDLLFERGIDICHEGVVTLTATAQVFSRRMPPFMRPLPLAAIAPSPRRGTGGVSSGKSNDMLIC